MKTLSLLTAVFLWLNCLPAAGETMYVTFVPSAPDAELQNAQVSLKIDGKDAAVQNLLQVRAESRDAKILAHPAGRRHYIFLFDLLFSKPEEIAQARTETLSFLQQLPPEELVAVAGITRLDGLRVFSNFTADRSKTIAGLNAFGKPNVTGWTEGPDGNLYSSRFSPSPEPITPIPEVDFLVNLKTYQIDEKNRDEFVPVYVQGLIDLVSLLSTVEGRKHVVFFSSGADVGGLSVDLDLMRKKTAQEPSGEAQEEHKDIQDLTYAAPRNYEEIANQGPGARILNKTQGADVIPKLLEGTDSRFHVFNPTGNNRGFLNDLAEKNGGSYNKPDQWNQAMKNVLASDARYYVVSWEAPREKEFHSLHALKVETPGVKVQAPEKWLAPKAVSDFSPLEHKARIAKAVYSDSESLNPAYSFWSDFILQETTHKIPCFVQISGQDLVKSGQKELTLEFYSFVIAADAEVSDFQSVPIQLDLSNPSLIQRLQKTGIKMWGVLLAGQAPVTIRSILLNPDTGDIFTHSSQLDFKEQELTFTNPFFPSTNLDWIVWPKPSDSQTRRGITYQYPYIVGTDMFFFPDLSPSVAAAEKDRVLYFKMYNSPDGNQKPPVRLELQAPDGQTYRIDNFGLYMEPRNVEHEGLELFWKIEALPKVSAGTYRLLVNLQDTSTNRKIEREALTVIRN